MAEDGLGVADVERVLGRQLLVVRRGLEAEAAPVVLHGAVVGAVEGEALDAEVGVEGAHAAPHPPPAEVAVVDGALMAETI